jgi:hypothetical protein
LQNAAWTMLGDSIGGLSPLTGQFTTLRADRPETARIAAVYLTNRDTTGIIIVQVGTLASLVIAPNETTITTDDSLQFAATGFDADGNITPAVGTLTWGGGAAIGTVNASSGRFTAATVGFDTVTVASSLNGVTDQTGRITVRHGLTDSLALVPAAVTLKADSSLTLTLTAFDADKNAWNVRDTSATRWEQAGSRDSIISGVYNADTVGVHRIIAIYDGQRDTCIVTVQHGATTRITVLPPAVTLTTDGNFGLTATAYDLDGNAWNVRDTSATRWEQAGSRDSIISGVYNADTVGIHRIIAIYDGYRDTCIATVQHGATTRIKIGRAHV